jgi:hypothetical protein
MKNLPELKMSELMTEIGKDNKPNRNREAFSNLLLNGPTFSKEQLHNIARTRKAINQWRTK